MLLCRFKFSHSYCKYSQVAAAVTGNSHSVEHSVLKKDPSFAKSFYVGNFIKDVFVRQIKAVEKPECKTLFGVNVPKEFGGLGLSSASISEAYKSNGFTNFKNYLAHGSVVKCINVHGTDEQKKKYLPLLATGENVGTFCMYEKKHGYNIQDTETKASCVDGKWVINGSKQWVTNGKQADIFLILAKTMDECNLPESQQDFFTAFLVNKSKNGIQVESDGEYYNITFNNVQADCMLGPENEGSLFFALLFSGDFVESSSATLGEIKKVVQNVSQNFNKCDRSSLIKLGMLNSHLYTMDCVLRFTTMILDSYDVLSDYETILARLYVSETSYACLNLLNDLGLPKKSFKCIQNSLLFDGRSNLLPIVGALLGIQHAGQYMSDDVRQLRNPLMFPKYTITHILKIQRLLKDKPKLTHCIEKYLHPSLKKQAVDLEYCLSRFQFSVQSMFINFGPDTYLFQMVLERANMIAMNVFALSAVLHKVSHNLSDRGAQQYPTELIFANVFCNSVRNQCSLKVNEMLNAPHNVIDPHLKELGTNSFVEKKYFLEHPLHRNIV